MRREMIKSAGTTGLKILVVIGLIVTLLHNMLHVAIVASSASLVFGIIGTVVAFIGNTFSVEAAAAMGSVTLPKWRWGNRMQMVGLILLVLALVVK